MICRIHNYIVLFSKAYFKLHFNHNQIKKDILPIDPTDLIYGRLNMRLQYGPFLLGFYYFSHPMNCFSQEKKQHKN